MVFLTDSSVQHTFLVVFTAFSSAQDPGECDKALKAAPTVVGTENLMSEIQHISTLQPLLGAKDEKKF